jgi:hypothetical protein
VSANGVSSVAIAGRAPTPGECDLCARGAGTLPATVVIRQATGAGARLDVCAFCARALRRLAATTAGVVRFVDGGPGPRVAPQPEAWEGEPLPEAPLSETLLEYPRTWRGPDGMTYHG